MALSVGTVAALQTLGSYAANFHPHVHAIVTDGAFAPDGHFERMGHWDAAALTELFRRLVLAALRREQRLSEEFHQNLLSWVHSGFSVHGGDADRLGDPGRGRRESDPAPPGRGGQQESVRGAGRGAGPASGVTGS